MVLRKLFGILAVVGALVFTLNQATVARQNYREWQAVMKIGDRSAMDLYRLNFETDCAEILIAWAFAGGLLYVLRSKTPAKP